MAGSNVPPLIESEDYPQHPLQLLEALATIESYIGASVAII
ncbi:hypothetical protein [Kytococcus schroeteri]|nr:hypothetical protein [Kytococcus schroeteri]